MAFGTLATSATNASTNPGASHAVGPVTVTAGQLAIVNLGVRANIPAALAISDNLGNTWTALTGPTDVGTTVICKWYGRITVGGSMTVTVTFTSHSDDVAIQLAVFDGPFAASPLDANPANGANDNTSPYPAPATGTLTQADELITAYFAAANGITDIAATSPFTLGPTSASGTGASTVCGAMSYRVVAATTTVTPEHTGSAVGTSCSGTASFKKSAGKAPQPYLCPRPFFSSYRRRYI